MSTVSFTVYRDAEVGAILRSGFCEEYDAFMQAGPGQLVFIGEAINDEEFYFLDHVPTERPVFEIATEYQIAADGVDAVSFVLPAGSTVHSDTETWPNEDEFYVSTEAVGTLTYTIEPAFPYRGPIKVTIHAA